MKKQNDLPELVKMVNERNSIKNQWSEQYKAWSNADDKLNRSKDYLLNELESQIDTALNKGTFSETLNLIISEESANDVLEEFAAEKPERDKKDFLSKRDYELFHKIMQLIRRRKQALDDFHDKLFDKDISIHTSISLSETHLILGNSSNFDFNLPLDRFSRPIDEIAKEIKPAVEKKIKLAELEKLKAEENKIKDKIEKLKRDL